VSRIYWLRCVLSVVLIVSVCGLFCFEGALSFVVLTYDWKEFWVDHYVTSLRGRLCGALVHKSPYPTGKGKNAHLSPEFPDLLFSVSSTGKRYIIIRSLINYRRMFCPG
jgi:hypothetical protein